MIDSDTTGGNGKARLLGRRGFLVKAGATGLALPAVGLLGAACGDDDDDDSAATAAATGHAAETVTQTAGGTPVDLDFLPNPEVAPPVGSRDPQEITVELVIQEVEARLADGAGYRFWTFGGTIPGPMVRVRVGDGVTLKLTNPPDSTTAHNIDLHAVDGPGGGAELTLVTPGQSKTFRFKAQHPGVYIYHCAVAPVAEHISNGMYGIIVVEPAGGLAAVDKEFYVCQGDIYTANATGAAGMQQHDAAKMLAEQPTYVVFNGSAGAIAGDRALKASVGDRVRIFFGVGGPNLTSAFHVIGEIFDTVAPLGSLVSEPQRDVQTVTVSPGSATMVEFVTDVPGTFVLVDHALSRAMKGCAGHLVVEGAENPEVYRAIE